MRKKNQGQDGRRCVVPVAVAIGLAASACGAIGLGGSDSPPGAFGAGDSFSVEAALAELPIEAVTGESQAVVYVSDLVAAGEANGLARPTGSLDSDEVVEWIGPMTGIGTSTVFASVPIEMRWDSRSATLTPRLSWSSELTLW